MADEVAKMYSNMWPRGSWARAHLNWALILYSWLALVPSYVVLVVTESGAEVGTVLALTFAAVVWSWYLMVWNLRHKGRSLWNLLYVLIPWVGGIVFLCISNRDQLAKGQAEMTERERYVEEYWESRGGPPAGMAK